MTALEALLSIFGAIGIACWPITLRDFHRIYKEATAGGARTRIRRTFVALPGVSLLLSFVILGSGLVHENQTAIVIGIAYAVVHGAVAVMMYRYRPD